MCAHSHGWFDVPCRRSADSNILIRSAKEHAAKRARQSTASIEPGDNGKCNVAFYDH